ncbi:MAG TPA: hypothetical protein VL326_29755 [Kofleriaceae bacterium]|nr:hypothetical protein [Kofleriaceae bacterium]
MRWRMMWLAVAACGEPGATPTPDAQPIPDSNVSIICGDRVTFQASQAFDVVSDNTSLFISTRAMDGTMQIVTVPIAGGAQTTLVTGAEQFRIASFDDAMFYSAHVGSSFELHQYVAGVDTVLGTVPANGAIEIAPNANDLYVLGAEGTNTTLWRFSRAGAGPASTVTTLAADGHGLAVGETVAAAFAAGSVQIIALPGPSTPIVQQSVGADRFWFIGDLGFVFTAYKETQNTTWTSVIQFWPMQRPLWGGIGETPVFTDDKYIYLRRDSVLRYLTPEAYYVGTVCSSSNGRYDKTHLLSLVSCTDGTCDIALVAKPL